LIRTETERGLRADSNFLCSELPRLTSRRIPGTDITPSYDPTSICYVLRLAPPTLFFLRAYSDQRKIEQAMQIQKSDRRLGLELHHANGRSMQIHPLWLRERCNDEKSLDERTEQRLYNPNALTSQMEIVDVQLVGEGLWHVSFNDGATGRFRAHDIISEVHQATQLGLPSPHAWNAGFKPVALPWLECSDPGQWREQLEHFLKFGFVLLSGVPTQPGSVLSVARRFGYLRETNFGQVFEVRSIPEANDLAYTGLPLDAHTDNPYRDPVPGVQLLHCLVNDSSGGLSTLVDGYAVAEAVRTTNPDAYAVLARTPVRFVYKDAESEYIDFAPIIEHDAAGNFAGIRFSPRLDFVPLLPPDALEQFYAARVLLDRKLRSSEFEIRFLLAPGELVIFDNRRVLHGRTAFDPRSGLRHLQGCYIDRDAIESKYRTLTRSGTREQ